MNAALTDLRSVVVLDRSRDRSSGIGQHATLTRPSLAWSTAASAGGRLDYACLRPCLPDDSR